MNDNELARIRNERIASCSRRSICCLADALTTWAAAGVCGREGQGSAGARKNACTK